MGTDLVLYYLQDCEGNEVPGEGDFNGDYFDIRQNDIDIDNITCDRDFDICCKKSVSKHAQPQQPITEVVSDRCKDFANEGFQCVEKFRCLDDAFG